MKLLKSAGLLILLAGIFFGSVYGYDKIRSHQESRDNPPIGQMVMVNGHQLHVYTEGAGTETLVFLAGWSTSSPVWDFKGLYSQLTDSYKVAVVERSGYGYSEVSDSPRDIDTVLDETRMALDLSGNDGPYVVVAHSVSGLEALYWAQKYPAEVKAVIGLDMSFPETYSGMEQEMAANSMKALGKSVAMDNFGFKRFNKDFFAGHEPLMFGYLTAAEEEAYKAAVYRSYYTRDMMNEGYEVLSNAQKVGAGAPPETTPMFLFIATEQGQGHMDLSIDYLSNIQQADYLILDGGHYIHDFEPVRIAERTKEFISGME